MKTMLSVIISLMLTSYSFGQNNFIQIETNKTLGLFSFLETSSAQLGTSRSFRELILDFYKQDKNFNILINSYSKLNLNHSITREEFPKKRPASTTVKDLLWIAASNSTSIEGFSQRIIGLLPHQTHTQLIEILKNIERYYDNLIWNNEQENIDSIENKLGKYKSKISELYQSISRFYNTSWNINIPFKIMLYPIPLRNGATTAIPKGNALICGFLSHNENEYEYLLGIIIHEMCHILYKEQSQEFQLEIDQWFANSDSPHAPLAYSFFNESLATVLGNGWAYKEIHKSLDSRDWYNNQHINGFAHSIFPVVEQYLNEEKSLDQHFVNKSIELFGQTFPKATKEIAILMNSLQLFANTEEEAQISKIANDIHNYFNIRSMWVSTPMFSSEFKETIDQKETTKLFVIHSDNINTVNKLQEHFPSLKIQTPINTINIFKDEKSKSTLVVINIEGLDKLNEAYKVLSNTVYFVYEINYEIK
ncbi:hypothetical protein ACFQZJ_05215 [Maribacter chungangensis]|uniref:M48 family metalloprotease n=1 Tax=Maribacter chungangensis TaxID=1069117 RepID=A0ABW3B0N9_9FLAO